MLKFIEESRFSNAGDILVTSQGAAFSHHNNLYIEDYHNRREIVIPPNLKLRFLRMKGNSIEFVSTQGELFYINSKEGNELNLINYAPDEEGYGLYDHYLNNKNISILILSKKRFLKIIMYDFLSKEVIYEIENLEKLTELYVDEERIIFYAKENESFIMKCFKLDENKLLWSFDLSKYFIERCSMSSLVTEYKGNLIFSINGSHTLCIHIQTGQLTWISENDTDLIDVAEGKAYQFNRGFIRIISCDTGELLHYQENWFDTNLYKDSYGLASSIGCFYKNYIISFSDEAEIFIIDKEKNTIVDSFVPPFKGWDSFRRPLMIYKDYLFMMDSSPTIYKYRLETV
ncbi:hypothetical protein [Emticicia sp. 21SJ11W-3]|uniref:hypothetical protein n=1 Tax=Emticicia sp. 21SJ11W-3 TaxID=2916755 RepID=UPI00209CC513|nr:hypothetical protein [Emticicia sp. 21SJ11W-3]UTA66822.1 hypothetical protein MB380_14550 [Emticicia sp. 21SJ11W-3]